MFNYNPLLRLAYQYFAFIFGMEALFCYMSSGFVTLHDVNRVFFLPTLICGAIIWDQHWGPGVKNEMRRISAAVAIGLFIALILEFTLLA